MKNVITITSENIELINPYQGNDQKLKIGDTLQLITPKVPCVYKRKGFAQTFSIYTGEIANRYVQAGETKLSAYTWMYNRFSINDKFTK